MAGGARSFIYPMIHWSIKSNVLDRLQAEHVDVFVRVSTQDNVHGHGMKSGNGVTFNLSPKFRGWLDAALKVINPLKVVYTTLEEEPAAMEAEFPSQPYPHPNFHHKIFRTYDKRRYSMMFNRHMGYHMALDYAKENNFEYDWFMNLRLDTGWVSPMEPISHYSPSRVWVPATWQEFCPDIFALVPAKVAPVYFDLANRMKPDLSGFCLGGPDFDENNCKFEHLTGKLGLNETHAKHVTDLCCKVEPWSHSEGILKNVLHNNKVWIEAGPFHVFIARDYAIDGYCGSLDPSLSWKILNFKEHIDSKNLSFWVRSMAPLVGCEEMGKRCKITVKRESIKDEYTKRSWPVNVVQDFDCPRVEGSNENFMPLRLQSKSDPTLCLNTDLKVTKCRELCKVGHDSFRIKHRWHYRNELFFLFNQQISTRLKRGGGGVRCVEKQGTGYSMGPCSAANTKFEFTFDASRWGRDKQEVTFKNGGDCMAIVGGTIASGSCDDESARFLVSYATDGLVVEAPRPSQFTEDHGSGWQCCNDYPNGGGCCNRLTDLTDAEYFNKQR
eukprot:g1030.t1